MNWLLSAYSDRRTYGSLAYSLLGLPIGVFGFVVVVTGFSLGLGLIVTLLGIPVLVATLVFARAMAMMERRLAWSLIGAAKPRRSPPASASDGIFWQRLRELVTGRDAWREVAFVVLRLPLGILGFTIAVTIVGMMFGGFIHPIVTAAGFEDQIGTWVIDTIPESLVYLPFSLLFLLVGPRILLGWGEASGRIATWFLGRVSIGETKAAVVDTLARTGAADAGAIFDALQLRFGRGPFLTSTRVEAALLALESTGWVQAWRGGRHTTYSLRNDRLREAT